MRCPVASFKLRNCRSLGKLRSYRRTRELDKVMKIRLKQTVIHPYPLERTAETSLLVNRFFESWPEPIHRYLHSLAQGGI